MHRNAFAGEDPSRNPLGSLQPSLRPLAGFWGSGEGRGREREEKEGEEREGKGKGEVKAPEQKFCLRA